MTPDMEMTNAGLRYKGSWEDICSFARDLEKVIEVCVPNEESVEEYNEWRPREEEEDEDMTEKTAEEASMKEKKVEEEFNGTKEELGDAGEKIKETMEDVKNGNNPSKEIKDASKHIERLVGAQSIKTLRKMEQIIYEKLMLRFNPCYFDTEDFSVNLEENGEGYVLTFNIPDDDIRDEIRSISKKEIRC